MPTTRNLPVSLSVEPDRIITADWTTRDGTATAGTDYTAASGTLTWPVGQRIATIPLTVLDGAGAGTFYVDVSNPTGGAVVQDGTGAIAIVIEDVPPDPGGDLTPEVGVMLDALWGYVQRATGQAAVQAGMPPLVTEEGLVKNSQQPETALGGYLPQNAATSEGISLLLRGVARAYAATGDSAYLDYAGFLMDAACSFFFFDSRPSSDPSQEWFHTWLVNGGPAFPVRGPVADAADQGGYVGVPVSFVSGVGQLPHAPEQVFQAATEGAQFVWHNVYADIVEGTGTRIAVSYYINAASAKVYGTQKGGSFGQPIEPGSNEPPGRIVLASPLTGTYLINYNVSVPGDTIAYGDPYEAWPFWRRLGAAERSHAADAIHWFADAFRVMKEADPGNAEWARAHARTLDLWRICCEQESDTTLIFKAGTKGFYNSFPITYAYASGQDQAGEDGTAWAGPPAAPYMTAERGSDGYVNFILPKMDGAPGSGLPVRYNMAFENGTLFLRYNLGATIKANIYASAPTIVTATIQRTDGAKGTALMALGTTPEEHTILLNGFRAFQMEPGDATGDKTGDWSGSGEYTPPTYLPVPFPGRRRAMVGDSITWLNTFWNPPTGTDAPWQDGSGANTPGGGWGGVGGGGQGNPLAPGYYEYFGHSMSGYLTYENQLMNQGLVIEPHLQDRQALEAAASQPVGRWKNGNNFAIAGSRVTQWNEPQNDTLGNGVLEVGPMFNARRYMNKFDVVDVLGGTNDLGGGTVSAQTVFNAMRPYIYELAEAGKWVFLHTVPPRTREWLGGYYSPAGAGWKDPGTADPEAAYTIEKQDLVRSRIEELNNLFREEFGYSQPGVVGSHKRANIWLVDHYFGLLGPNGKDPFGHQSNDSDPLAQATIGNFRSDLPGKVALYDGLHEGPPGAYVMALEGRRVKLGAGVPLGGASPASPLTFGANLLPNPAFQISTARPPAENGQSSSRGRARGLGAPLRDATHQQWTGSGPMPADIDQFANVGLGYEHGQVPNYWQFYRAHNPGPGEPAGEGWSNFNEYTWGALAQQFPNLNAYMGSSTWQNGAAQTSVVSLDGEPAFKIHFSVGQTGNKNESFVVRTLCPGGQHGAWDSYGYAEFDWAAWFAAGNTGQPPQSAVNIVPNTLYAPGDKLMAKAEVRMGNMVGCYTWRMALNFLSVDIDAVNANDMTTTGAPICAYAHSQNFWPPSLLDVVRSPRDMEPLIYQTPIVTAPAKGLGNRQYFAQLNFEFAFDASQGPAGGDIIIRRPGLYKLTSNPEALR